MNRNEFAGLALAGALLCAPLAYAKPEEAAKAPALDPKAILAAMSKYSAPGDSHKVLKSMEGVYTTSATVWLAPGAPPDTATGRAEFWSQHGDRFMIEEFSGTIMGQPVTIHVIFGYDVAKKKYTATMISSVATETKVREGTADASGKVITFTGSTFDPVSGKYHPERAVYKLDVDKKITVEVFETAAPKKEWKKMEVVYSRK